MNRTMPGQAAVVPCPFCATLNRVDLGRIADRPKCGDCGKPILLDRPVRVSDENFERVVAETSVPVLIDFYADWCAPCRMMAPVLDEIAHDRAGSILVAKLDTDRNPNQSVRFSIRSIPTLILFRDGAEIARHSGLLRRSELDAWLDGALQGQPS
jgi:thioredoxin 2